MVDDSINMANDVDRFYREPSDEEQREIDIKAFIDAARGDLTARAPFNYGVKDPTVFQMLQHSLNDKGGVTLATIFSYLASSAKDGDNEAVEILEKMADQFRWIAL